MGSIPTGGTKKQRLRAKHSVGLFFAGGRDGVGQHVDISIQEAGIHAVRSDVDLWGVDGTVKMHINDVLTDEEVEEGWILTCQSVPTSATVKVAYE